MKFNALKAVVATAMLVSSTNVSAMAPVYDETSLQTVINSANTDTRIKKIVIAKDAVINLSAPVIYNGSQSLKIIGNNATIDGASAGSFEVGEDLTAITKDGTLIFNTAGDLSIYELNIINSATRGLVVNIPADAQGEDIEIKLHKVNISDSALYGLHIDDNADEFDDGVTGSAIGINLNINRSNFTGNGTGAIDFDGVRVDERAEGDIHAVIIHTHIDGNGGDGIELDEAGNGDVDATMMNVTLNGNGFYNEEDLDDGFDIDEADDGNLEAKLFHVEVKNNMDEGLDFDEAGDGDVKLKINRVLAVNNADEAIKVDEEDDGDIEAMLKKVTVRDSGDDGIQFTELDQGSIEAKLKKVFAENNAKYGIKMEQWVIEGEDAPVEEPGELKTKKVTLSGNGEGDEIKTNMIVK